jgi:hypothetical protein
VQTARVVGSHRATALMELHQGETIALPPTGPLAAVAEGDDSSVLAALRKDTNVAEEAGPIPLQPRVPGGWSKCLPTWARMILLYFDSPHGAMSDHFTGAP